MLRHVSRLLALSIAALLALVAAPPVLAAPASDPFYAYSGSEPLSSFAPGTVLKTRTMQYHVVGIPTPLTAIQYLYRTTDAQGRPSANVTSVVRSLKGDGKKALSYQSFYDSLDPEHGPSRAIAGSLSLGGIIANAESLVLVPALLLGYNVVLPDTQGQTAEFAAGPGYGTATLDSIRAVTRSPVSGMNADTKFGLIGYSGGAIATNWAVSLAPTYAPEVNEKLVGFAEGGLLVAPAHNLKYVSGSLVWTGVIPMAIVGVARAYDLDVTPYLSDYGRTVLAQTQKASIVDALGRYPGLTWQKLAKPKYGNPNSVPALLEAMNKINLGQAPTPTVPGYIGQGNNGALEGTFGNPPGIGTGDAVMVAGDVRSLARQYCKSGNTSIKYDQYNLLSHVTTAAAWVPGAIVWLQDRFAGKTAPSSCGRIAPGNSLAPELPAPTS